MISVTGTLKLLSSVDVELIDSLFFLLITFIRSFHSNIIVAFNVIRTLINDLLNNNLLLEVEFSMFSVLLLSLV